ncbi:hypothetical protein [Microbacterium sp. No. 7]|uniref:hypothetical protein n=1 Tax=Microbacterium sp. No. 7 TaxID=1714373 RepID=UPI0006D029C3|nr:hypothetical protein [Microbacterium sp. No. 7]ALJ21023.1 hypothetical protein AOA12_14395 [Microbacterium sp. No. 7]
MTHRRTRRPVVWATGAAIGVPLSLIVLFVAGSTLPGGDGGVVAVADRVRPGPGWVLELDRLQPDLWINMGGVPDPSVHRTWTIPAQSVQESFVSAMSDLDPERSDSAPDHCRGEATDRSCFARFVVQVDGKPFTVVLTADADFRGARMNLIVDKTRRDERNQISHTDSRK